MSNPMYVNHGMSPSPNPRAHPPSTPTPSLPTPPVDLEKHL
eukprot:CAMPEP_0180397522 /NCGR_PEP_ID=MMETSP0989-20121125/36069_1 /TAXON_ID=697907 /ORGANISM="non described non described, Strain CCMP2293" /LENGTH=40 /DNA_ID= /DNA_START= /DNA_END= /DNA_ORIENTATION=